jgi:hypothetical protein
MFVLWPVGEASMAAGPVGIAGGVFGGRDLFVARSTLFTDSVDGFDGATGFKLSCLCGKVLPSLPLPTNDSQLSLRDGARAGAACPVVVELRIERNG